MTTLTLQHDTDDIDTVATVLGQMYPKVRFDPRGARCTSRPTSAATNSSASLASRWGSTPR